jgi:DNA-binding IclR family transcriptional regulator
MSEKKYIQSIERALDIIEYIGNHKITKLNEICDELDLKPPTAHGLIQSLKHRGYITKVGKTHYGLGINCLKMGLLYGNSSDSHNIIHNLLCELVDEIDETCYFELKIGEYNYIYDIVLSTQPLKVVPDDEKYIKFTENSAINMLYNTKDKEVKYVIDIEGVEKGLNCMAIPYKINGKMAACIVFTAPSYRFTKGKMKDAYDKFLDIMKKNKLEEHI